MGPVEFLAGTAVIVILCLILGFTVEAIVAGVLYILAGLLFISELFFIIFFVRLIAAKRVSAVFSHIGRREGAKFDTAFYITDEGEFPNIFPCEVIMRDKFYKKDKKLKIRLDRFKGKRRRVFDRNASMTVCLGLLLCAPIPIAAIYMILK